MSTSVILGLVGGILVLVSMFLPWLNYSDFLGNAITVNGIGAGLFGLLMLIFGVIGIAMMFLKNPTMPLLTAIFGILAIVFWLLAYLGLSIIAGASSLTGGTVTFEVGFGAYIAPVGAILMVVGGFMRRGELKKAMGK